MRIFMNLKIFLFLYFIEICMSENLFRFGYALFMDKI